MARPKTNKADVREEMLQTLDALIKRRGSHRVTLSEVAEACGMSQSNAYRFFASKKAMMEAGVERWFLDIDAELGEIVASRDDADRRLARFLKRRYELKRAKHDADPELFAAHLAVADDYGAAVAPHVGRMQAMLESILADGIAAGTFRSASSAELAIAVEMLAEGFSNPWQILRHHQILTPERVDGAIAMILAGLAARAEA